MRAAFMDSANVRRLKRVPAWRPCLFLACVVYARGACRRVKRACHVSFMHRGWSPRGWSPRGWSPSLGPHAAAVSPVVTPEKVDAWAWIDHACAAQVQRITWIVREGFEGCRV